MNRVLPALVLLSAALWATEAFAQRRPQPRSTERAPKRAAPAAAFDSRANLRVEVTGGETTRLEVPGSRLDRALRGLRLEKRGRPVRGVRVHVASRRRNALVVDVTVDRGVDPTRLGTLQLVAYDGRRRLSVPLRLDPAPAPDLLPIHAEIRVRNREAPFPAWIPPDGPVLTTDEVRVYVRYRNQGDAAAVFQEYVSSSGPSAQAYPHWELVDLPPGTEPASGGYNTVCQQDLSIDPGEECQDRTPILGPGIPVGEYRLHLYIDPEDAVEESIETNNVLEVALSVEQAPRAAGAPNLRIASIDVDPVEARVTVINDGSGDIYWEGGKLVGASKLFQSPGGGPEWIPAGETRLVTMPRVEECVDEGGPHTVVFTVDPQDRMDEKIEDDNESTATVVLPENPGADLVVNSVTHEYYDDHPVYGVDTVSFEVTVRNAGLGHVCHPSMVPVSIIGGLPEEGSPTWTGSSGDAPGRIDAGATTRTWIWSNPVPPGTYEVRFEVDPDNEIAETSELNNFHKASIVVGP